MKNCNEVKALILVLLSAVSVFTLSAESFRIWGDVRGGAKSVTMEAYLPEGDTPKTAIIVCPGGSYHWLDKENEGRKVGEWLKANGIAAFVLHYRVAGIFAYWSHYRVLWRGNRHPDMIQDVQRAIQIFREKADEWGIDTNRVGVMGFSAGGHLAAMSAIYGHTNFLTQLSLQPKVSVRPNFAAAIYPVVTFHDKRYVHRRSRKGLLGELPQYTQQMQDSLSLELHVTADCPPLFILNCKNDPIVKYQNSELLDSALTVYDVPHKYIQYQTGGHGFGASDVKGTPEARQWRNAFLEWLRALEDKTSYARKSGDVKNSATSFYSVSL